MHTNESLLGKPLSELTSIYNAIPGVKPVKRFADRKAAVGRILSTAGAAQSTTEKPAAPQPTLAPTKRPSKAAPKAEKAEEMAREYKPSKGVKQVAPRSGSKRAEFFAALRKGVDCATARKKWGWSPTDVRDVVGQLSRRMGHTIERTAKGVYRMK